MKFASVLFYCQVSDTGTVGWASNLQRFLMFLDLAKTWLLLAILFSDLLKFEKSSLLKLQIQIILNLPVLQMVYVGFFAKTPHFVIIQRKPCPWWEIVLLVSDWLKLSYVHITDLSSSCVYICDHIVFYLWWPNTNSLGPLVSLISYLLLIFLPQFWRTCLEQAC